MPLEYYEKEVEIKRPKVVISIRDPRDCFASFYHWQTGFKLDSFIKKYQPDPLNTFFNVRGFMFIFKPYKRYIIFKEGGGLSLIG